MPGSPGTPGKSQRQSLSQDQTPDPEPAQKSPTLNPSTVPPLLRPGATPVTIKSLNGDDDEEDKVDTNIWARDVPAFGRPRTPDLDLDRVPSVLRPGSRGRSSERKHGGQQQSPSVPDVLRPGSRGRSGERPAQQQQQQQQAVSVPSMLLPAGGGNTMETNPFKRKMQAAKHQVPTEAFAQLEINEQGGMNPWQASLDERQQQRPTAVPNLVDQDPNVWASRKPSPTPAPTVGVVTPDEGAAIWADERKPPPVPPPLPPVITSADDGRDIWGDIGALDKGKATVPAPPIPPKTPPIAEGKLVDTEPFPPQPGTLSRKSTWEVFEVEEEGTVGSEPTPVVPSVERKEVGKETEGQGGKEEVPKEEAPREEPQEFWTAQLRAETREAPREASSQPLSQRQVDLSETYQIKNINWYDSTAKENPRASPILVQNANGPCPLVALVNALTLTTPADQPNTVLVETLRSREQVSLGLLLDAVFEELMRRTQPDATLPDPAELYDFLTGLHTGMNVNPRFVPTPEVLEAFKRTSLTHLPASERDAAHVPGTFEHTREMSLYATFGVPLIHGWLPPPSDPAHDAFKRHAGSYEEAHLLLFREEELEEKLRSPDPTQGLTTEEQQAYQDILTIKSFLSASATQLTPWGLDVIRASMKPGSVAILFRNDHFSTLYRHPHTLELFTLVTDAGYAGHPEVVWESLVDVTGESTEFFSGDFRVVGGASSEGRGSNVPGAWEADNEEGWTTVQSSRRRRNRGSQQAGTSVMVDETPRSPVSEQEDRDLALALQLQEEENERLRAAQEQRRREALLSEQYIEQQAREGRIQPPRNGRTASTSNPRNSTSSLPNRGQPSQSQSQTRSQTTSSGNRTATTHRPRQQPPVRSMLDVAEEPAPPPEGPPPSYEQAARQKPYIPPAGHPAHPESNPLVAAAAAPYTGAAGSSSSVATAAVGAGRGAGGQPPRLPPRPAGQASGVTGAGAGRGRGGKEKERDCIVM